MTGARGISSDRRDSKGTDLGSPFPLNYGWWENVCKILRNPGILEEEDHYSSTQSTSVEANVDTLVAQRQKLQHGMVRLIDNFAEGVIDKDQFTPRMNRTKTRISEIDAKIAAQTSDQGRQARLRLVRSRPYRNIRATCKTNSATQTGPLNGRSFAPLFSESRLDKRRSQLSSARQPTPVGVCSTQLW